MGAAARMRSSSVSAGYAAGKDTVGFDTWPFVLQVRTNSIDFTTWRFRREISATSDIVVFHVRQAAAAVASSILTTDRTPCVALQLVPRLVLTFTNGHHVHW
eukprot:1782465-Amphidinium_carterae.1